MSLKVYEFKNCSTCKNALKFLDAKKVSYVKLPIVETPPSVAELKKMLQFLKAEGETFKKLFNTSGEIYRELKVGDKIKAGMTEAEAIELLSKNGKLIKRPFLLASHFGIVGFKEEQWSKLIKKA